MVFICFDLFRHLTTGAQHGGAGARLQGRDMGGVLRFFLIQLGGHSALCFLISYLPWSHE